MKELVIPAKAQADPNAVEMLRAWIADSGLHVSISPGIWQDSGHWGIALADIIRHLADAYQQTHGAAPSDTVARIFALLRAEFASPTDTPSGSFIERQSQ